MNDFLNEPNTEATQKHLAELSSWLKGDWNKQTYMINHMTGLINQGTEVEAAIKETLKAFGGSRKGFDKYIMPAVIHAMRAEMLHLKSVEDHCKDAEYELDQYEDNGIIKVLKTFRLITIKPRK